MHHLKCAFSQNPLCGRVDIHKQPRFSNCRSNGQDTPLTYAKRKRASKGDRIKASFDEPSNAAEVAAPLPGTSADLTAAESRDDDVLPDSLSDALLQAGQATSQAVQNGATRCLVEVILAEFWDTSSGAVFAEEGDQQRFWKLSRRFVDSLAESNAGLQIRIVYPDTGVAAMLKNSWADLPYELASLIDRRPVSDEDDLIVIAAPDPLGLDMCKRIAADLDHQRPMILFNPRLASGDVGVGLNVRRMRSQFLSTFQTTYCLRPIGEIGSVFRRYPGLYQVFVEDPDAPGRFKVIAEQSSRPAGEELDRIIMEAFDRQDDSADEASNGGFSVFTKVQATMRSLQRFAKQLQQ